MEALIQKKKILICLHGFLGRPTDWDFLAPKNDEYKILALDYVNISLLAPKCTLQKWPTFFVEYIKSIIDLELYEPILIGYSQGGRLALHVARDNELSKIFKKYIFISTGIGLLTQQEIEQRIVDDKVWADDFLHLEWSHVLKKWNAQGIFENNNSEPLRLESDYQRSDLALILKNWSLATQENIEICNVDSLWLVGDRDPKYQKILSRVKGESVVKKIIPNASHRLMFDNPQVLKQEICTYLGILS